MRVSTNLKHEILAKGLAAVLGDIAESTLDIMLYRYDKGLGLGSQYNRY
jgi:hypothetical protein